MLLLTLQIPSLIVQQPTYAPVRTYARLPPVTAGLFDIFKESVSHYRATHDGFLTGPASAQEEDKRRKEEEFKAIQELQKLRRDPAKMAEYEAEARAHSRQPGPTN